MSTKPKKPAESRPAAFLDRDGVLIHDSGYVYKPEDLILLPDVPATLKALQDRGYLLIVVSNQAGVGRGYFGEEDVRAFHQNLGAQITAQSGAKIDAFYYCPHHPDAKVEAYRQNCLCRKPGIGMIEAAQKDFAIDMQKSFMVGDRASDIACARAAGLKSFQIASGQYELDAEPFANIQNLHEVLAHV